MIKQYHRNRKHRDVCLQKPTLPKTNRSHPRISAPAISPSRD
ncbi:uncharacterized protein METZ01_LOCUS188157 [marine metagenome]|uniref:Uncharacterized protein n=1 Tax=marine metagenome TaxID=408172 RepID=A0A382DCF5_9ZZZZ